MEVALLITCLPSFVVVAGSLAFVVAGFIVSLGLISWFHFWNLIPFTVASSWAPVLAISVICAMVELVSPRPSAYHPCALAARPLLYIRSVSVMQMPIGDDNITVPAAASLFAVLFFT
jgi:dolichol kinase